MHIHQFNIQYQPEQDRVLARINTSTGLEFRLWLTRRLTLGLLPVLHKVTADQAQKRLVAQPDDGLSAKDPKIREFLSEFKKEQTLQQADFKTPYKEPALGVALEEPLLVSEVQITPLANANLQVKFMANTPHPGTKREVMLELDDKLLHGMLHLLERAHGEAQWARAPVLASSADAAADPSLANSRPQYLN